MFELEVNLNEIITQNDKVSASAGFKKWIFKCPAQRMQHIMCFLCYMLFQSLLLHIYQLTYRKQSWHAVHSDTWTFCYCWDKHYDEYISVLDS